MFIQLIHNFTVTVHDIGGIPEPYILAPPEQFQGIMPLHIGATAMESAPRAGRFILFPVFTILMNTFCSYLNIYCPSRVYIHYKTHPDNGTKAPVRPSPVQTDSNVQQPSLWIPIPQTIPFIETSNIPIHSRHIGFIELIHDYQMRSCIWLQIYQPRYGAGSLCSQHH